MVGGAIEDARMHRTYDADTCAADVEPGDQLRLICVCGHEVGPATARWPARVRRMPMHELVASRRLICGRCGGRKVRVEIHGILGGTGSQMTTLITWPAPG